MMEFFSGFAGALIALFGAFIFSKMDKKRAARYLAIRIVCILDKFLENCVSVVKDDGLSCGSRTKDGCLEPQVDSPGAPIFPDDVDWKSIDHSLMYEILSFPSDVEAGDNAIAFAWNISFPPDYEEGFEERAFQYAGFGLKAYELAKKLRGKYGIPDKNYEDWNPVAELQKELEIIQTRCKKREEVNAQELKNLIGAA